MYNESTWVFRQLGLADESDDLLLLAIRFRHHKKKMNQDVTHSAHKCHQEKKFVSALKIPPIPEAVVYCIYKSWAPDILDYQSQGSVSKNLTPKITLNYGRNMQGFGRAFFKDKRGIRSKKMRIEAGDFVFCTRDFGADIVAYPKGQQEWGCNKIFVAKEFSTLKCTLLVVTFPRPESRWIVHVDAAFLALERWLEEAPSST